MATQLDAQFPSTALSEAVVELRARAGLAGRSPLRQLWIESGSTIPFEDWLHNGVSRWHLSGERASRPSLLRFMVEKETPC